MVKGHLRTTNENDINVLTMICLGCDYNKKVQDLTHQFYRKSEAKAEDSSVSLSGSLPAFSPLLPEAQHLLLPPPLSPVAHCSDDMLC